MKKYNYPDDTFSDDIHGNATVIVETLLRENPGKKDSRHQNDDAHSSLGQARYRDLLNVAMPADAVLTFARNFFETKNLQHLRNWHPATRHTKRKPYSDENELKLYHNEKGKSFRTSSSLHISEEEYDDARQALRHHPEIDHSVCIFEHMVSQYLDLIQNTLNDSSTELDEETQHYIHFIEFALNFAKFDEFNTVLSPSLALSDNLDALDRPIEGQDLTSGIKKHLQGDLSGFAIASHNNADGPVFKSCPFQHADGGFMRIWNTRFERQEDGSFTSRPETGGFFNSVMGELYPDKYPQFSGIPTETADQVDHPAL